MGRKDNLAKIILGILDHEKGDVKIGHNVKMGYFAQNQEELLDENKTVFDTVDEIAKGEIRPTKGYTGRLPLQWRGCGQKGKSPFGWGAIPVISCQITSNLITCLYWMNSQTTST